MKFVNYRGDSLSKLSLGTVQFGLDYGVANNSGQPRQNEINEIVQYVSTSGINFFDTAQAYGNSESVISEAIREKNIFPYVVSKISSKVFLKSEADSIVNSLTNLKVDAIFGFLLHDSALLYEWLDEYEEIVNQMIAQKQIKYFGVSIYTSEDFELAIKNDSVKIIQVPFNIFDQRALHEFWFEEARKYHKLIVVRSVYLQGLLLMNEGNVPDGLVCARPYIKEFEMLAKDLKVSKNELALSFVDSVAKNALILFGCENLKQAKENICVYEKLQQLDDEVITNIIGKFGKISEKIYNPTNW